MGVLVWVEFTKSCLDCCMVLDMIVPRKRKRRVCEVRLSKYLVGVEKHYSEKN